MTALTYDTWTEVTTTTVDTLFQAKRGRVLLTTIDPSDSNFDDDTTTIEITDNTQLNGLIIFPAGLTVWAKPVAFPNPSSPPSISYIPFGV
jgi:hypothetical protein